MKLTATAVADWAGRQGADPSIDFATYYAASQSLGRPSKLSPALIDQLIEEYRLAPIGRDAVCDKLGISDQTRRNWCKQGEVDYEACLNTLEAQFFGVFKRARGYWQGRLLEAALQGTQQWACYVTLLERMFPSEFGRRVEDNNGPNVIVQIGVLDRDVAVNTIAHYKTQSQSEGLTVEALASAPPAAFAGERTERKSVHRAKGRTAGDGSGSSPRGRLRGASRDTAPPDGAPPRCP